MLELYEYLIGLDGKGPSLFDILTSVYLTKPEMADSAKATIDASMYDLKALRQLKEMARDAKSRCSYMDVCCNVAIEVTFFGSDEAVFFESKEAVFDYVLGKCAVSVKSIKCARCHLAHEGAHLVKIEYRKKFND